MKKQYGVAVQDQKGYNDAAGKTGGNTTAVERPMIKIEGPAASVIAGEFELPDVKEVDDTTLQVAIRVLGVLVTKDMLSHTPPEVNASMIGSLLPYIPFSFHKRFGATYTDRVCPASTRQGHCPACAGRVTLFGSDQYKIHQTLGKKTIMDRGFGTRNMALVVARIYFNDEDLGIRVFTTPTTNPKAEKARYDNFFDLVANLAGQKKMLAGETLPPDYYSNGDGARWLIAEYTRALYVDDAPAAAGEQKGKRPVYHYWKLSRVSPMKELEGMGKASDIWWPEVPVAGGKKNEKQDAIEIVDPYALIDYSPEEEFAKAAADSIDHLLNPKKKAEQGGATGAAKQTRDPNAPLPEKPTWDEMVAMDADQLVEVGVGFGGEGDALALVGAANLSRLRLSVAKLCGVTPRAAGQPAAPQGTAMTQQEGEQDNADQEHLPF